MPGNEEQNCQPLKSDVLPGGKKRVASIDEGNNMLQTTSKKRRAEGKKIMPGVSGQKGGEERASLMNLSPALGS
jgi:hypothetical protein